MTRSMSLGVLGVALGVALGCAQGARQGADGAVRASKGRFGVVTDVSAGTLLGPDAGATLVIATGAGVAGDRISGLLEIPDDQCAVIIARGGESLEDLDLFAYGEDGSVVGSDEKPDPTPALLICPPHPRRVWVAARIASGHGLVALGAQRSSPEQAERAAAMFGASTGDATRSGPAADLDERLAEHQRDLGAEWQLVRRAVIPLEARTPTRLSAEIAAGRCLDAFLMPADSVGHVEVDVIDEGGAIVARASEGGRARFVVLCASEDARLTLELRPQSGRGLGILVLSQTRPGSEGELDAAVGELSSFVGTSVEEQSSKLEATLARLRYGPGKTAAKGTLDVGSRSGQRLTLPRGCTRLDVLGGAPLRGLDAWLWSSSNELVASSSGARGATLFACGSGGLARLDLEATLRPGPFVVVQHAEPDVPAALMAEPLAAGRLLANVTERGVLRRASEIGRVQVFELSSTKLANFELTVPFGRCLDVALALGRDATGAELRLVSESTGQEVAYARGPQAANTRVCALDAESTRANLKTRAELRVEAGSGKGLVATRMLSPSR